MALFYRISVDNFTVFGRMDIGFSQGLNVFIGENGMGKTHLMKLLYCAGKAARHDISFPQKIVNVFMPDESSINRLVSRRKGVESASVQVLSDTAGITTSFNRKTPKWDAEVIGESNWEKQVSDTNCVFIPAKEILSNGWHFEAAVHLRNVEFDETYVDVVSAAKIDLKGDSSANKKYLDILQKATSGRVLLDKDRFYIKRGNNKLEFNLIAEGIRKLALLWQLINNGALESGSALFWDEPEANLNPKFIPLVAEMLIQLQKNGVQVFVSTHDYFLCKYLEIKRAPEDHLMYHSLYPVNDTVGCESQERLSLLEHNAIQETFLQMYDDEIQKAME